MVMNAEAAEFRRQADAQGLILRTSDEEESRFVYELKAGRIATSSHPGIARQLLLLAESVYGPDRGEARELSKLVAKRAVLEEDDALTTVIWLAADKAHATAPEAYRFQEWVAFAAWIEDQFLLEDAIARMDEGVPV